MSRKRQQKWNTLIKMVKVKPKKKYNNSKSITKPNFFEYARQKKGGYLSLLDIADMTQQWIRRYRLDSWQERYELIKLRQQENIYEDILAINWRG
jgi:hypothetical protein